MIKYYSRFILDNDTIPSLKFLGKCFMMKYSQEIQESYVGTSYPSN